MFKKHLLSSAAFFAPPGEGGVADPPNNPDDRIPEPDLDDDETVTDPVDEGDGTTDDEGEVDDEGGDEGEAGDDGEPPRQPTRGDRQYADLRRQARETARQNADLTRQVAELNARVATPAAPLETHAQRAERLALMSPEERIQEMVSEQLSRHERNQQQLTSQLLDQSDRSGFDARCATNPLFKKLAPKVEAELSSLRAKGQNLSREAIATYLIGQRVIEQQGSGRAPARQRRQQQNSRPVNSRGDGNRDRGQRRAGATDIVSDAESRFGDVPI